MNRYERYKDSGIPWLGEVPEHWNIIQFRRVVENIKDGTHGTHSRENNGFPLLSAKNVFNDGIHIHDNESQISEEDYKLITSNGFPRKNDLLITCVGSIGRCCVYPFDNPIAFQRSVAFLRLNKNSVPQFYKYFVESICYQEQLRANIKLSIQGGVYLGTLVSLYVSLPPQKEQTAIAHYLDTKLGEIDALIGKQQTLLEKLAEQRTAVITHAVTKGLNPAAAMKNSGMEWLGDVPEHWDIVGISKLFMLKAGGDLQPDFFSREKDDEHCYPIYTNANDEHAVYGYTSKKRFNADSITVSGRGDIGFAVYRDHDFDAIIRLLVLSPLKKLDCKYYTYSINALLDFKFESSAVAQLSTVQLAQYKLLLPSYEEQANIAEYLDNETAKIDRLCDTVNQTIGCLKEYRTALITQAVTGKIKCRK
jgi:type I restriction-modification